EFDGPPGDAYPEPAPERAVFSPRGDRLYYPSLEGRVVEADPATLEAVGAWDAHGGAVTTIDLSPKHSLIATGGSDGFLRVWSVDLPGPVRAPERRVTQEFLSTSAPVDPLNFEW